ncbi:MAG: hypothetical protein KAS57_00915 [Gammaproteobacteria bacterium]|nr:hypothetical protein [Gammaproteobacteria bacterium]
MSVINTMLKDLERRGVECSSSDDAVLGGLSSSNNPASADSQEGNPYLVSLVSLVSVVSILAIVITVYYLSPYQLVSVAKDNAELQITHTNKPDAVAQAIHTKPVVVAQNEVAPDAIVATQVVSEQSKIIVGEVAAQQVEPISSESPSLTSPVMVDSAQNMIIPKKDVQDLDIEVHVQETTTVTAPIKSPQTNHKQQKVLLAKTDVDNDRYVDDLQVVNKKQRVATDQEKSQQAYATARSLYKEGSKQRSKALLQEALGYSANNREAYRLLSVIYLEDGRADLASETLEQGLLMHVNDQKLLRLYLQALVQNGKYIEAISVMEQRLKLTTPEDLGYLAGLYQKNNDHLNAVAIYSKALQLKPSNSIWWMGQGISFEKMKKYSEALQSYQQSISTGQLSGRLAQYAMRKINFIKQLKADSTS